MSVKPARWAVNPGMVAPSWRWAWRGLEFIVPFFEVDPSTAWEAQGRRLMPNSTADAAQVITPYGVACYWDNTQSGFQVMPAADANARFNGLTEATFWTFGSIIDLSSGRRALAKNDHATVGNLMLGTTSVGAGSHYRFALNGVSTSPGTVATNEPFHMFGVFADSSARLLTAHESETWRVVEQGSFSPGASISWGTSTWDICAGGANSVDTDTLRNWYGYQWIAAGWSRALTETEMQMLARDPFGPIRPAGTLIVPIAVEEASVTILYATADGTVASVVNELDTTTNLYTSVDDDPGSPNDSDWINNTGSTGSQFLLLTDMPADFATADSGTIKVRYRGQGFGSGTVTLYAQLYQSNETTTMSDEVQVAQVTGNGSFANTADVTFTGLDTGSGKSTWDGARIKFRWATT